MKLKIFSKAAALCLGAAPLFASAATDLEIEQMISASRSLNQRLEEQEKTIRALQQRLLELERQSPSSASHLHNTRGRGTVSENSPSFYSSPDLQESVDSHSLPKIAATEWKSERQTPAQKNSEVQSSTATEQAITSTQGIPLFARKFSFEQSLTYTHYDKRSLALNGFLALDSILLGTIDLQQIKTDQFQYDMTFRWNVSDRVSVDFNLPAIYRSSDYFSSGAGGSASTLSEGSNSGTSIGDVNAGLYYQFRKASPTDLDWIGSVRIKAPTGRHPFGIKLRAADPNNNNLLVPTSQPTGNGVWSTTLGLSVLKTYDPAILFGNVGYTYNFRSSFGDLSSTEGTVAPGEVELGNSWSLGAGIALALNDKTSVTFSFAQSIQKTSRLRAEGGPWVRQVGSGSNAATLNIGLTNQLTSNLAFIGILSTGITPDAPDFSVGIKLPYSF
jgi:hypothetical protein